MPDLNLPEWEGLVELLEIDLTAWDEGYIRLCNSKLSDTMTLGVSVVTWEGDDYTVLPFTTTGWRSGGDGVERPRIEMADFASYYLNRLDSIDGATLAPMRRIQVLAADLVAQNSSGVISIERYMVNKIRGNGFKLLIELATDSDGPRSKFPGFPMTEEHYPGLMQNFTR